MRTRRLGKTGYNVSELGYGAWGLGGDVWRGVDDADGRKALREAVDQGSRSSTQHWSTHHAEQRAQQRSQATTVAGARDSRHAA